MLKLESYLNKIKGLKESVLQEDANYNPMTDEFADSFFLPSNSDVGEMKWVIFLFLDDGQGTAGIVKQDSEEEYLSGVSYYCVDKNQELAVSHHSYRDIPNCYYFDSKEEAFTFLKSYMNKHPEMLNTFESADICLILDKLGCFVEHDGRGTKTMYHAEHEHVTPEDLQ